MEVEASLLDKPGVVAAVARLLRASPTARQLFHGDDGAVFYVAHEGEQDGEQPAEPGPSSARRSRRS